MSRGMGRQRALLRERQVKHPLQMEERQAQSPIPTSDVASVSDMPQLPLGVKQEVPGPVRKADLCLQVCLPESVFR